MSAWVFVSIALVYLSLFFFFFNDTATTEIYTLSLHDALPISIAFLLVRYEFVGRNLFSYLTLIPIISRSEEHTSELQSLAYLVCRLLLEKKNQLYMVPGTDKSCMTLTL